MSIYSEAFDVAVDSLQGILWTSAERTLWVTVTRWQMRPGKPPPPTTDEPQQLRSNQPTTKNEELTPEHTKPHLLGAVQE